MYRGLDSSPRELYCGGMATLIYSTGYNECGGVWFGHGHMTGLFQIKEETDGWSPAQFTSPARGYYFNDFGNLYDVDIIDYEEARHWPHP